jgi:hypothetical protein
LPVNCAGALYSGILHDTTTTTTTSTTTTAITAGVIWSLSNEIRHAAVVDAVAAASISEKNGFY